MLSTSSISKKKTKMSLTSSDLTITPSKKKDSVKIRNAKWTEESLKEKIHIVRLDFAWKHNLKNLTNMARENNAVVVAINLPYVSWYSSLVTSKKMVNLGLKKVEELISQGVPPKNIIIDGLCLTSAFGTLIAKKLYDKGMIVNLFNDRSFFTTDNLYKNFREENKEIGIGKRQADFIDKLVKLLHYRIDIRDDFMTLYKANPDRINYITFRPKIDVNGNREKDGTIAHKNSIHKIPELVAIRNLLQRIIDRNLIKLYELKGVDPIKTKEQYKSFRTSLLKSLYQGKSEFESIKPQDSTTLGLNLELFSAAISEIEESNDIDSSIIMLNRIKFVLNENHKVEKLYPDNNYKDMSYDKYFELAFKELSQLEPEANSEEYKQKLYKKFKNDKKSLKKTLDIIKTKRGHIIGRSNLKSRLYNNTVEANDKIDNRFTTPSSIVKNDNAFANEEVIGDSSLISNFVDRVRALNKKEKVRPILTKMTSKKNFFSF
jgi:hypothetical protein